MPGYKAQRGLAQQDKQCMCVETRQMGLLDQEQMKGKAAHP